MKLYRRHATHDNVVVEETHIVLSSKQQQKVVSNAH